MERASPLLHSGLVLVTALGAVLLLLAQLGVIPQYRLMDLLIFILPAAAFVVILVGRQTPSRHVPCLNLVLLVAVAFALAMRWIPYIGNTVPLGYDAGLYKYTLDLL